MFFSSKKIIPLAALAGLLVLLFIFWPTNSTKALHSSADKPNSSTIHPSISINSQCTKALEQVTGLSNVSPAALSKYNQSLISPITAQANEDLSDELQLSQVNQSISLQNQYLQDEYKGKINQLPSSCRQYLPQPPELPLITGYYAGYVYKG